MAAAVRENTQKLTPPGTTVAPIGQAAPRATAGGTASGRRVLVVVDVVRDESTVSGEEAMMITRFLFAGRGGGSGRMKIRVSGGVERVGNRAEAVDAAELVVHAGTAEAIAHRSTSLNRLHPDSL
jgi:hypothetical protein